MHVFTTPDAETFAASVGEWLGRRPVENNLLLSHAFDPASQLPGDGPPTFGWVTDGEGGVVGAAWVMPPYRMTISPMPSAAVAALAENVAAGEIPLPGVNGYADTAGEFAHCWSELTGRPSRRERDQWLMRCDRATKPSGLPGKPRPARFDELDMIAGWFATTMRDSGLAAETIRRHTQHMVDSQLAGDRLIVWEEDGRAVGAAGWMRPIAGVARPAGVYVRPDRRGGGHAAGLLGEVTARALEGGCDTCVCHHYLHYPAMQAVVEKVGYRRVWDVTEYRFD
jgi:GNAT superfamily N-acetyltransferase